MLRFANFVNWECDLEDTMKFFEWYKQRYAIKTYHEAVKIVKRLLKHVNAPFVSLISSPKLPKRSKIVVKREHIQKFINKAMKLPCCEVIKQRFIAGIFICSTSGLRVEELYKLSVEDIDVENRTIRIRAENAKDREERITFFSEEAKKELLKLLELVKTERVKRIERVKKPIFWKESFHYVYGSFKHVIGQYRLKLCRKFFSQQSDRFGMPTAAKKILMGHSLHGDVDLQHYDYQDEEELKQIYDRYWRDFCIFDA